MVEFIPVELSRKMDPFDFKKIPTYSVRDPKNGDSQEISHRRSYSKGTYLPGIFLSIDKSRQNLYIPLNTSIYEMTWGVKKM